MYTLYQHADRQTDRQDTREKDNVVLKYTVINYFRVNITYRRV